MRRTVFTYGIVISTLAMLYVGSYAVMRWNRVARMDYRQMQPIGRFVFAGDTRLMMSFTWEEMFDLAYRPCLATESWLMDLGNPGKGPYGPKTVSVIQHQGQVIGIHRGVPGPDLVKSLDEVSLHAVTGFWDPTDADVRGGLDALLKVRGLNEIGYKNLPFRSIDPEIPGYYQIFTQLFRAGRYGIQAFGLYEHKSRYLLFNLGADLDQTATRSPEDWAARTGFSMVYDGGIRFVRVVFGVDDGKIYFWECNGP